MNKGFQLAGKKNKNKTRSLKCLIRVNELKNNS